MYAITKNTAGNFLSYMTRPAVERGGCEILRMLSASGRLTLTMYGMSKRHDTRKM